MAKLLCIGEILVEMVASSIDQSAREPGTWIGPFPSGAPAILADQAALSGADVSLVGSVGADAFGETCLERLRRDGVNVDGVSVDTGGTTGVAFVRYRSDGSRSFLFHLAESASGRFAVADLDAVLGNVDCVHLMGSSAFSGAALDVLDEVFDAAVARGVAVSFDPNVRPEMLTRDRAVALRRILHGARFVLASEGELTALLDEGSDSENAMALLDGGASLVVVKRGRRGASLYLPGRVEFHVEGIPVTEVDATGAGDCFGGTFVALILQGTAAVEALRLANVAGAMAVTERGPMSGNRTIHELRAASSR